MRGSVKHLFEEFRNSLWGGWGNYQGVPEERRESHHSQLHQIAHGARQRKAVLPGELQSLRQILCELLSASLVREPDWTDAENIHKLRMYRTAAFIDCLRPNVLDWETPHIPDMERVLKFIDIFTRPGISLEEQAALIEDLSRPRIPLGKIVQTERGERLKLSLEDLRYVWQTRELSHEARALAWDTRTPKPFQPLGRPNLEMYGDKKLRDAWRVAVNRQLDKATAFFDLDTDSDERELN